LDAELPNNLSSKKTHVAYSEPMQDEELPSKITDLTNTQTCGLCHNKSEVESIDEEINHPIAATDSSKNQWQMSTLINLNSSGFCRSSKTEVSATTMMNQNAHLCLVSPKTTHLRLASPQCFSSACIPFSTICSNLSSGLTSWVQSLVVKVQVFSIPSVSHHAFTLLVFEPVTSTKQISSPNTALNPTTEMQPSTHISQNLGTQLIFQLIDASISNKDEMRSASQLTTNEHKGLFNNKTAPTLRLIDRFKQQYHSKMQRDLINFSLSKTISIAKIDTTSIAFQLMAYPIFDQFSNSALSLGHKSSTTFKLVVASVTKE
jgi:hypothetical protein